MARYVLCAPHAGGAMGRRGRHGGGTGVCSLGTGAPGVELERGCDVEGRTRANPERAVPEYPASDLHRDPNRICGECDRERASARTDCGGDYMGVVLYQGAARRSVARAGVWAEV